MRAQTNPRAFTLTDLLGVLATGAVLGALAVAGAGRLRQEAQTASSLSQLRWLAGVTSSYAADSADRFWTFSWQAGHTGSSYPDLRNPLSDRTAAAFQAIDLLRRRAIPDMPLISAWLPHILYNHLPLLDYLDQEAPDFRLIAPDDTHRLAWARDPDAFAQGVFLPFQPEPTLAAQRWVYSSSYELPPAFFDQLRRIAPLGGHVFHMPSEAILGAFTVYDVAFASQKVHIFDRAGRGSGAERQFALLETSRTPALIADGSASVVATCDSNPGWHPARSVLAQPTLFPYEPYAWEPGPAAPLVTGHYRWTRGGIAGRDFGGPEIDTGQP